MIWGPDAAMAEIHHSIGGEEFTDSGADINSTIWAVACQTSASSPTLELGFGGKLFELSYDYVIGSVFSIIGMF